jgi:hypothetical protein
MLGMNKSLQELKRILRIADGEMKKSSSNLMIQEGESKIKKTKRKVTPKVALKYKSKGKKWFLIRTLPRQKPFLPLTAFAIKARVIGRGTALSIWRL